MVYVGWGFGLDFGRGKEYWGKNWGDLEKCVVLLIK